MLLESRDQAKNVPESIGRARIVLFTPIDERHRHTNNCRQIVAGESQSPAAGLAICADENEKGFYLFGCDANWNCLTDTWHQTVEDAMRQAEFEYEGVSETWIRAS